MNFIKLVKHTKYLLAPLFVAMNFACSSSTVVKIASDPPGAKIFIKSMGSSNSEEFGVTPLTIKGDEIAAKKFKDDRLIVEMKKEGYYANSVLLTETVDVDIDISLTLEPYDKLLEAKKYDQVSAKLFEIQRLIRRKNYDEALQVVGGVKKDFPELSVPDELEGSIFYLKKDFQKALQSFNTAYAKNSENNFSLKMKKLLEAKLGRGVAQQ